MARILLSAYACAPERGSEPAVGWNWATELASQSHEVCVITRRKNRGAIEGRTRVLKFRNLRFVYCDLPGWCERWKGLPGGIYVYYLLWQWLAYRVARSEHAESPFDVVQHVTFVSLRGPSFMGRLGIPFYFGPVSGGECVPQRLRRQMGWLERAFECVRDVANAAVQFDPLMRFTFRSAERIYLTSAESVDLIPQRYRHKCQVQLAVGLSTNQLGLSGRAGASYGGALHCLYVGRLLEWKGLRLALLAVATLKRQGAAVRLKIVGDGPFQRELQKLLRQLGIEGLIEIVPWLPHAEVQQEFRRHHVFLFPSLRDSGGMAVLEALAHGLPVVCTDLGGPGTIVTNQCGRVVSTRGRTQEQVVANLAEQLLTLAYNRGLLASLSIQARRRAWDFEFSKLAEAIHENTAAEFDEIPEAAPSWA